MYRFTLVMLIVLQSKMSRSQIDKCVVLEETKTPCWFNLPL